MRGVSQERLEQNGINFFHTCHEIFKVNSGNQSLRCILIFIKKRKSNEIFEELRSFVVCTFIGTCELVICVNRW
jgi:hypothetical protein